MELKRRKFQGVLNILSFNRHFYFFGLLALALIVTSKFFVSWPLWLFASVIAAFAYGLIMPLIVSAYVYDYSGYYDFDWIEKCDLNLSKTKHIVNINAGFDETSFIIANKFPEAEIKVFDFYDPQKHTEAAIIRARKVSQIFPNTEQIKSNKIPIPDHSTDVVFLLSAVHEIRSHHEKIAFLSECYRICKPDGKVIMVEHLRDFPNFVAFSIGFTHFFSKKVWRSAFEKAGFNMIREEKFTPFMSIFNCSLNANS